MRSSPSIARPRGPARRRPPARPRPARAARRAARRRRGKPDPDVVRLAQGEQIIEDPVAEPAILPMNRRTAGVGPVRLVAEHVVADEVRRPVRARRAARGAGRGTRRPARRRPRRGRRSGPSANVAGLPMSWSERGQPDDRPVGPAPRRRSRSVWSQRSSPAILFWATPRCAASSAEMAASSPVSASSRSPTDGRSARRAACRARRRSARPTGARRARPVSRIAGQRRGLDRELERRGEPDGADHPQRVLLEPGRAGRRPRAGRAPRRRRARRTDRRAPVQASPGGPRRPRAPGHRVDREVAPREVDLDRVAELDPVRPPEVGVVVVGPERRDLEARRRRAGPRPSRTGSRRPRPGRAPAIRSGSASVARSQSPAGRPSDASRSEPPTTYAAVPGRPERLRGASRTGGRDRRRRWRHGRAGLRRRQLRPRNRYVRHASLRSSARYGVNSE